MYILFYLKVFLKVYFSILFLILLYHQFSSEKCNNLALIGTGGGGGGGAPISLQPAKSLAPPWPPNILNLAPPLPQYSKPSYAYEVVSQITVYECSEFIALYSKIIAFKSRAWIYKLADFDIFRYLLSQQS